MKIDFKKMINVVISLVGIVILLGLIQKVGLAKWGTLLRGADKIGIVTAVAIYASTWVVRTLRFRSLIRHMAGKLSTRRIFEIHMAGFALNAVLPAKAGDVATVGFLKNDGMKTPAATAVVFQTRILDMLALVVVAIPSLFWLIRKDTPVWMLTSFLVCLLVVVIPFAIIGMDKKRKLSRHATKLGQKVHWPFWGTLIIKIGEAYEAYHGMVRDRALLLFSVICSVVIWTLEGAVCFILLRAFALAIPLQAAILAVALGNVGKGFQVTPGGIGVYEGILTAVLCGFGVPFEVAVTVAVLDHLLKKGFNLAFGLLAFMRLRSTPVKA